MTTLVYAGIGSRGTRRCAMLRMSASPTAPLRAHFAPQCPPLNRRCGSGPPGSPASISPFEIAARFPPSGRRRRCLSTPHAAGCRACHGGRYRVFPRASGAIQGRAVVGPRCVDAFRHEAGALPSLSPAGYSKRSPHPHLVLHTLGVARLLRHVSTVLRRPPSSHRTSGNAYAGTPLTWERRADGFSDTDQGIASGRHTGGACAPTSCSRLLEKGCPNGVK